jgi:hypothetical protein
VVGSRKSHEAVPLFGWWVCLRCRILNLKTNIKQDVSVHENCTYAKCEGKGKVHSFKVVRACAFVVRNVKGWNCVENCLGCNVAEVDEMLSRLGPMICTLLY